MTLRSDVAELLAGAGILDVDVDEAVADEHVRSAAYRRVVLATVASRSRDRDRAIVATLLRDPNATGAKSAVVALVDGIATRVTGRAEFRQWSEGLRPEIDQFEAEACRAFIRRRIHDWLFRLSIEDGLVPGPVELAEVTNWMQRVLAEESTSPAVLALLAESGSTKKIRNIARNRPVALRRPSAGTETRWPRGAPARQDRSCDATCPRGSRAAGPGSPLRHAPEALPEARRQPAAHAGP